MIYIVKSIGVSDMASKPQNNDWNQNDQDNYDSTYQKVTLKSDKLGDWILAAITLTATGQVSVNFQPDIY